MLHHICQENTEAPPGDEKNDEGVREETEGKAPKKRQAPPKDEEKTKKASLY